MKRYRPWLVGLVLAVAYFAVFETLAFTSPDTHASLSNAVATIGHNWPLSIWFCGYFAGMLSAHFFWPWRDNPMGKGGG